MRGRLVVIVLAAIAVAVAFAGSREDGGGDSSAAPQRARPPADARPRHLRLLAREAAAARAADRARSTPSGTRSAAGRCSSRRRSIASGEARDARSPAGTLKPVAWSPASSLWGRLLELRGRPATWSPDDEPVDRAHAARDRDVGADGARARLAAASRSASRSCSSWRAPDAGWSAVRPARSGAASSSSTPTRTSRPPGLSAVVAEYYAATGKREGLTRGRRDRPACAQDRARPRALDRPLRRHDARSSPSSCARTGPATPRRSRWRRSRSSSSTASAAASRGSSALYPEEGTFYSDNPFIVLDARLGDAPSSGAAAEAFRRFLAEEITPEVAARAGFRPADVETPPVPPVSAANGVDPTQPRARARAARAARARPDQGRRGARTASRRTCCWCSTRRARWARRAGSSTPSKGVQAFLAEVAPQDRVGLTDVQRRGRTRSSRSRRSATNRARLQADRRRADRRRAGPRSTTRPRAAFAQRRARSPTTTASTRSSLLTDGEDTDSERDARRGARRALDQGDSENAGPGLHDRLRRRGRGRRSRRSSRSPRRRAASRTSGDTEDIETVYRSISSFF